MRRALPMIAVAVLASAFAVSARAAKGGVPPLVFPVVGTVDYHDDFGEPRGGLKHQGNDILADKRAPALAVEAGTVKYWTTSPSAGCMLYLYGVSGTMYEYIHLNNDLTARNDNAGKCVKGTAYAVPDGAHVDAGQQIGYVGDSGDANGIHPHLHFEVHPRGNAAADPFPFLKRAAHALVAAPAAGSSFTLKLTGTVVASDTGQVSLRVQTLAAWPSHLKQRNLNRTISFTLPEDLAGALTFAVGQKIVVWTLPAPGTVEAITAQPGALSLDRTLPG
jgi:hypothetical protein